VFVDIPYDMPALSLTAFPLWYTFFCLLAFTWGTCIGSFMNACIYRIPHGLSVSFPRSFCPTCHMKVAWFDNIPIFSWLALRGRCRCCRSYISPRYLLVEVLVGILFLLTWFKYDMVMDSRVLALDPIMHWQVIFCYWLVIAGLVLGTFVDLEHFIIPDRVTIGGMIVGVPLSVLVPQLHGVDCMWEGGLWSLLGLVSGFSLLWMVGWVGRLIFKKEAMGFGDVKLMGAIGAFLGWQAVIFTVVVSSFIGSAIGIALVLGGKRQMQSRIPYGPYLSLAALLWMCWGQRLVQVYVDLMTLGVALD
jgi:leader peptidase (prepilin peptidase)/N-methyltransferase